METKIPLKVVAREDLCIERMPKHACGVVIFGASGDLARRKLLPAFFDLHAAGLLHPSFFILGAARTALDDAAFRKQFLEAMPQARAGDAGAAQSFAERLHYEPCAYDDGGSFANLKMRLGELEKKFGTAGNTLYYLSTPPDAYATIAHSLSRAGLLKLARHGEPWTNVVFEKPFGRDLDSARRLDQSINGVLDESQIYRIDHYLGKETVQNIMMFRFANLVYEPVWNRRYIDHVQITASETLGVEARAGYYDKAGVLRDMFQNHMMQLLSLVAMEPPITMSPEEYRDEKVKVLRTLRPIPAGKLDEYVVRGQYGAGTADGKSVPGYLSEKGVKPGSATETFAAMKVYLDNWRWDGVPFYLRSGKRLAAQGTEIVVQFKKIPHSIFAAVPKDAIPANRLVLRIQPDEGIALNFVAKSPGPKFCMSTLDLDFSYREVFGVRIQDAYQRLLIDCMNADQTLFVRQDTIDVTWAFLDGVLKSSGELGRKGLHEYPAGAWGPEAANQLIGKDGREWKNL